MNRCRQTVKMAVPCPPSRTCSLRRGGRATGQPQDPVSEAYLNSTRRVRDLRKPGRMAISPVAVADS